MTWSNLPYVLLLLYWLTGVVLIVRRARRDEIKMRSIEIPVIAIMAIAWPWLRWGE